MDGSFHPLIVLSRKDHMLFIDKLNSNKAKNTEMWQQYRRDMTRIEAEEKELQKVNRFLRIKRPDKPSRFPLEMGLWPGWGMLMEIGIDMDMDMEK